MRLVTAEFSYLIRWVVKASLGLGEAYAVVRIEPAALNVDLAAVVVDVATVHGRPRRSVEVQGDGDLRALVRDFVQAEAVADVGHLVLVQMRDALRVQLVCYVALRGHVVQRLGERALQHLHQAVGIGVVVHGGAFPGCPHEHEQIGLRVYFADAVPRVLHARVAELVLLPVWPVRLVVPQPLHQDPRVDLAGIDPGNWPENLLDVGNQLLKLVWLGHNSNIRPGWRKTRAMRGLPREPRRALHNFREKCAIAAMSNSADLIFL